MSTLSKEILQMKYEDNHKIGKLVFADTLFEDDLTITVKTSSGQMIVINKDEII